MSRSRSSSSAATLATKAKGGPGRGATRPPTWTRHPYAGGVQQWVRGSVSAVRGAEELDMVVAVPDAELS